MADIKDLKKLSPEERLARLRKLQQEKEQEIEVAKELLKEAEEELEEQEERERTPIDQLRVMDESMLTSEEERAMFRAKRYKAEEEREGEMPAPVLEKVIEEEEDTETARRGAEAERKQTQYATQVLEQLQGRPPSKQYSVEEALKESETRMQTAVYNREMDPEEKWHVYHEEKNVLEEQARHGATYEQISRQTDVLKGFAEKIKGYTR